MGPTLFFGLLSSSPEGSPYSVSRKLTSRFFANDDACPRSFDSYSAPLYVDMKKSVYRAPSDEDPVEVEWEHQEDEDEEQKIFIGKASRSSMLK